MEDVVAVRVVLDDGTSRYFVTWGRIQDNVDPEPVQEIVLRHARVCSLGSPPVSAHLCATLREAAESVEAPYFYEAMVRFSADLPRDIDDSWRAARDAAMRSGREIYYCGRPS